MNNERRKCLQTVIEKLAQCRDELEEIWGAEGEARDSLPDNLQGSNAAAAMDDAITDIVDAIDSIDAAESSITNALGGSV